MNYQSQDRVAAVISTFHPPKGLPARVLELSRQVSGVFVVDDGSDLSATDEVIAELGRIGCRIIRMPTNSGIAAALNTGIEASIQEIDPDFIITLDQDSALDDGYVLKALEAYHKALSAGIKPGLVGAESHNNRDVPLMSRRDQFPQAFDPLQSGALIPVSIFRTVGLLDEDLFIDCVDSEFNLRVRSRGFTTLIGPGCNMIHALGDPQPMMVFGWHASFRGVKRYVHSHSPFRVYYMTRNNIWLWRKYGSRFPGWLFRRLRFQLESDIFRFLYGANRKKQVKAYVRGIRDGWNGQLGKIDPKLNEQISSFS